MAKGTFAAAINCMDGRTQIPVNEWIRGTYGVDYVDTITEPGPDGLLAAGDAGAIESIRKRLDISVNGHGSQVAVVVGHDDCAGNPVPKEETIAHVRDAVKEVASWGFPITVVGVWVCENWKVEVVEEIVKS